ncbi:MAG: DUF3160 domain-containing protein [Ktedonobacterales bacterium]
MSTVQPFAPSSATYFDLIQQTLALTDDELALLTRNGFVVTDRVNFRHFAAAYAYLHLRDLPVLITTDSLLHATHQGFDAMLQLAEEHLLAESLRQVLQGCRDTVVQMQAENDNPLLAPLLNDLFVYFSVPLAVLDDIIDTWGPEIAASIRNNPEAVRRRVAPKYFIAAQKEAELPPDVAFYFTAVREAAAVMPVALFGEESRNIDFTLFTPRGHYTKSFELQKYFGAQSWLQQVDFRLVTVDAWGRPVLQPTQLAAAMLLLRVLEQAGVQATLDRTEAFLTGVFGPSDNTTLQDFARFLTDAGLHDPQDALAPAEPDRLLHLLLSRAYGQQRITGQLQYAPEKGPSVPRPVSLLLLGPRFVMDSLICSEVVFDRLIVNGKKMYRQLPHPLDVLYVLGNDRALVHLSEELARYGYRDTLDHLRQVVAAEAEHHADTLYYGFLHAIRALNLKATGEEVPGALRGEAWQDKMLQAQLAAWAELRHDSILYAKQSFTMMRLCSYPAGYVEPYPAFYSALADYSAQGLAFLLPYSRTTLTRRLQDLRAELARETPTRTPKEEIKLRRNIALLESLEAANESTGSSAPEDAAPGRWTEVAVDIMMHFEALHDTALTLRDIAEKELAHQPCSEEEIQFLKDTIFYQSKQIGSGGPTEFWTGWYPRLFQHTYVTEPADCVADIHTKPSDDVDPYARVLHIATGRTAMAIVLVDGLDEPTLYVGPTTSYYEFTTVAMEAARREADETWRATLDQGTDLPVPSWTRGFRSSPDPLPAPLQLH